MIFLNLQRKYHVYIFSQVWGEEEAPKGWKRETLCYTPGKRNKKSSTISNQRKKNNEKRENNET
ncbi:MAG: hypothetical protein IIZ39_14125, partial [Blautia sp.]|nr:hypothetical protein [Blautia sp.]